MSFTNNFRIERIYFEKLKSNIDILKSYIEAGATGEALEILKNSVDVDGAVLLLYRNLGEAWSELANLIQKTQKDLKDLAEKTEAYHDELNERIDEVNNYLMALIRELDARLQAVEQDLATMNRNKFYDLVENAGSYLIEKDGETVSFDDIKADADFPHNVILRYDNGTSETELEIREFTDARIDFYSIGLADSDKTVKEILVSIADTEAVTYSENTLENPLYTFGTGLSLDSNNEISVDTSVIQEKLTEGFGIDIDSNNEISVDTNNVQEKLIAGQNITLTPDATDPTKTVIDAQGGANYSEGFGIDIDANDEISVDTNEVQEKLIAGQNITLTPDSTDPTKTVIKANVQTLSPGSGIELNNNAIEVKGLFPYTFSRVILSASNLPSTTNFSSTSDRARYYRHAYAKVYKDTERFVRLNLDIKEVVQGSQLLTMLNGLANKYHFNYGMTLWLSDNTGEQSVKREAITLSKQIVLDNGQYVPYATRSGTGIHPTSEAITLIVPIKANQNYVYAHITQEVWTLEDVDILTELNDANVIVAINNLFTYTISSLT